MHRRIIRPERSDGSGLGSDGKTGRPPVVAAGQVCEAATREAHLVCLSVRSHLTGQRILAPRRVSLALMPIRENGPPLPGAVGPPATQGATV
jgi:hypothetical protein